MPTRNDPPIEELDGHQPSIFEPAAAEAPPSSGPPEGKPHGCTYCDYFGPTRKALRQHTTRQHSAELDSAPAGPSKPSTKRGSKALTDEVTAFLAMAGVAVAKFVDPFDGTVIVQGSSTLATALVNTSEKSPKLRNVLERMVSTWTYSELVLAVAGIAVPILAHHGVLPPQAAAQFFAGFAPDDASSLVDPPQG